MEVLEGRIVPAVIPVVNTDAAGVGSLRDAIERANLDPAEDTIDFAPAVTGAITLLTALPELSTDIVVSGPGASALAVARSNAGGTPAFRIFTVAAGAEVAISGLTITGGRADQGGGIANAGTLTVTASTLSGNSAGFGGGGGIWNSGTLTVIASTLSGNATGFGGGGFGGGIRNAGTLTVTDSTLSGNSANGFTFIRGPFATGRGGGIENSGTATVTASTLVGNAANSYGGGIWNSDTLTVAASTLSGNAAGFGGGGIYNVGGTATVAASTLTGNAAGSGGGILFQAGFSGTQTATTSLFANPAGGDLIAVPGTAFVSGGHNLFSDTPGVALDATDLVNTDPLLGPLADNGGPTFTHALLPGSPAIDTGVAAGVTADQRGVPRLQGAAPDIGAFESRGFTLALASGDGQSTPALSPFAAPLVVRVASPFGEPVAGGRVTFVGPAIRAIFPPIDPFATLAGNPVPIGPDGRAAVTATANGIVGRYTLIARARGAAEGVGFALTNTLLVASLTLTPPSGPLAMGQPLRVPARLTNQDGTPLAGVAVTFRIVAGPNAGAMGTPDPVDGTTDADGRIAFTYVGNGGVGTDTIVASAPLAGVSSTVTVTWTAATPPPPVPSSPTVLALQRFGFHARPTALVLTFSTPLDPARARDVGNYRLVMWGRPRRTIRLRAARYDAAAETVTLGPARRLPLSHTFTLTVAGTAPDGLTSSAGVPLAGQDGQAGTDFVARVDRASLVLPTSSPAGDRPGAGRRP